MTKTLLPQIARNALVTACAFHIIAYLQAVPVHLTDKDWPAHARFHVFQALLWIVGLDLVLLLIALYPYARGERWAFWALIAGLFTSHLGYFLAMFVVPGGAPPDLQAHIGLGVILALYVLGLLLGERGRQALPPATDASQPR
jgi:cytochrome bd-type quinol oxidase subunit 2